MFYKQIISLKSPSFKRRVGIQKSTFRAMTKEFKKHEKERKKKNKKKNKKKAGRKPTLCMEDQLLMTLMYWREYRTQFHIGIDYGVSEALVCRTVQKVENILSSCKKFQLPQKKKSSPSPMAYEVVLIDATETPIERPKKNSSNIIQAKRNGIR